MEQGKEEGSFLQEVLSSFRGSPLHSSLVESAYVGLEKLAAEKEQEQEEEEVLYSDGVETKMEEGKQNAMVEEEEEVERTVCHIVPPSAPAPPQTKEEEPALVDPAPSCPAVGHVKEEEDGQREEQEEEVMEHSGLQVSIRKFRS